MHTSNRWLAFVGTSILWLMSTAPPGATQQGKDQQQHMPFLPEVTVQDQRQQEYVVQDATTGTKTDTPLIETPQSISVITRG